LIDRGKIIQIDSDERQRLLILAGL